MNKGSLYIVATPIGNLEDITLRALSTLKSVDLILAEDTRHSLALLRALGIKNNLESLHAHNEQDKAQTFIEQLLRGKSLALISDAGTPLISDPGYPLVKLAHQHEIPVIPIPGPCAFVAALSAAGIPCESFLFLGFLPAKPQARQNKLESLRAYANHTVLFYESKHRISECLEDLGLVFGETCRLVLCKELTKAYERFISGTVLELQNWLAADPNHIKGEFVLIIPAGSISSPEEVNNKRLSLLLKELPLKQAVHLASELGLGSKNKLYDLALKLKKPE